MPLALGVLEMNTWGYDCFRRRAAERVLTAVGLLLAAPAFANDTVTYTYDALGRLVTVVHQGGPNDGTQASYTYDPANNRSNVTVTGAHPPVVVVPLNGFTVIPLVPG